MKVLVRNFRMKWIAALFAISLLSGCAMHAGYMTNSASLTQANFSYVQMNIKGDSRATYVLGIGGFNKNTLVNFAKQQMLADHPLKNNQALVNVTVNFKRATVLGIYTEVNCRVTADVVEFK